MLMHRIRRTNTVIDLLHKFIAHIGRELCVEYVISILINKGNKIFMQAHNIFNILIVKVVYVMQMGNNYIVIYLERD